VLSLRSQKSACFIALICLSPPAAAQVKADRIIIVKSARTMTLMSRGKVLKTYKVALGTQPAGAKDRAGDHKTPEGN